MVDVTHNTCEHPGCNVRASYGIPCNKPTRCTKHKLEDMIMNPTAKCREQKCKNIATYGSTKPIHCECHKDDNDINLVERVCVKCGTLDVLFEGKCVNMCCVGEQFKQYKKNTKKKELRVFNRLKCEFGEPTEYGVCVGSNCGMIKPGNDKDTGYEKEMGWDFDTHKIYVEVDENQHRSHSKTGYCRRGELNRMINIFQDDGGIPVLFLRYNPDSFTIGGKKQTKSLASREEELIKWLNYYKDYENFEIHVYHLSVQYLFYDERDNKKVIKIDPDNHNPDEDFLELLP
tara:strand:+ start:27 stop:890 length:864 start_codon:yes stop_codon:yes gene_type:complete